MDVSKSGQSSRKNTSVETSRPPLISAEKINNGATHKFQTTEFSSRVRSPSTNTKTADTTSSVLPKRSISAERKRPSTSVTQPVPASGARLPDSMWPSTVRSLNVSFQSDKLSLSNKKPVGLSNVAHKPGENTLPKSRNPTPERKRVTVSCEDSKPLAKVSSDSSTKSIDNELDNTNKASNALSESDSVSQRSFDGSEGEQLERNLIDNISLQIPINDSLDKKSLSPSSVSSETPSPSLSPSPSVSSNPSFVRGIFPSRTKALNPASYKGLTKRITIDQLRNSKAVEGFHARLLDQRKWPSSTTLKVSSNSLTKTTDTTDETARASNLFDGSEQEEFAINDISPRIPKIGYSSSCPTSPEKTSLSPSSTCSVSPSQLKAFNPALFRGIYPSLARNPVAIGSRGVRKSGVPDHLEPHRWPSSTVVKVSSTSSTKSNTTGLVDRDVIQRRMSFPDFGSTSPEKLDSDSVSLVSFDESEGEKFDTNSLDDDSLRIPNNISSSSCPVSPDQASLSLSSVSSASPTETRSINPVSTRWLSPSQTSASNRASIKGVSPTPSRAIRGGSLTPSRATRGVSPTPTRTSSIVSTRPTSPTPTRAIRGVSLTPTVATRGVSPTPTRATRGVSPTPTRATRGVSPTPSRVSNVRFSRGVSATPTKATRGVSPTPTKASRGVSPTPASISSAISIKEASPTPVMSTKEDSSTPTRVIRGINPTLPSLSSVSSIREATPPPTIATRGVTPTPTKVTRGVSPTPTRASRGVSPTPAGVSSVLFVKGASTTPTMTTKEVNPTPTRVIGGVSPTPASMSSVISTRGAGPAPTMATRGVSLKPTRAVRGVSPTPEAYTNEVTRNPATVTKGVNPTPKTTTEVVSPTLTTETTWLSPTPTTPTIGVSPTLIRATRGVSPTPTLTGVSSVVSIRGLGPTPTMATRGVSATPTRATNGVSPTPTRAARGVSPTPIIVNRGVSLTPSRSTRGVSLTPTTTTVGVSPTPTRTTSGASPTPSTASNVSSPTGVNSSPRTLNLVSKRGVSPSRIRPPDPPTPRATRGASPTPFRPSSPMGESGNSTIDFNFTIDIKKGNKDSNHAEDVHQLRLLDNIHLQWRYANARADKLICKQKVAAERKLYSVWRTNSELSDLVTEKKINIEELKLQLKLYSILYSQIIYLKEWTIVEKSHTSILSQSIQDMQKATLNLPVVGGARVNIHSLKGAVCSAVDLMQRIGSSICSTLSRVEGVNALVSELARVAAEERALLDECEALFSTADLMQVEEYSLRAHLVQFKQAWKDDEL